MAQKEYIITLSDKKDTIKVFTDDLKRTETNKRDLELFALDFLVGVASQSKKQTSDFCLCADLRQQLDNLTEDDCTWVITQGDYNIIMEGFRKSGDTNQRPQFFSKLSGLFSQLVNPTPKENDPLIPRQE